MKIESPYPAGAIDPQINSHRVDNGNGLDCHVLEAGDNNNPCLLLLHGFPELSYSYRKIMLPLAAAGYHVLAPDQRGYGQTNGADNRFHGDVGSFRLFNLVRDAMGVVAAFGHDNVHAVIGHDFGSSVAAWCAVIRPDFFKSVALMSAPFSGTPPIKSDNVSQSVATIDHHALAQLSPPRKHYQWYYSTQAANDNMQFCPQGVHDFLRAYYHQKSADWTENKPRPLLSWAAEELANLPDYYVMPEHLGMAETVAPEMPDAQAIQSCRWLTDDELSVYSSEYKRTGFQGGLNWYRCVTSGQYLPELQTFSGLQLSVPAIFIAGASDWGIYQKPGELQAMQSKACSNLQGCHFIEGAGHWVQQEQPEKTVELLLPFLDSSRNS